MEEGSESSNGSHSGAWKDEINTTKVGAGYFLSLEGRCDFNASEYISFRGLKHSVFFQLSGRNGYKI